MTAAFEEILQFKGMESEVLEFAKQVNAYGQGDRDAEESDGKRRAQPEQGARDIAVFEALWASSKVGGMPVDVQKLP